MSVHGNQRMGDSVNLSLNEVGFVNVYWIKLTEIWVCW